MASRGADGLSGRQPREENCAALLVSSPAHTRPRFVSVAEEGVLLVFCLQMPVLLVVMRNVVCKDCPAYDFYVVREAGLPTTARLD